MSDLALFHSSEWNQCVTAFLRSCSKSGSAKTHANYQTHLKQFFVNPAKSPNWYSRAEVEEFLARPCASVRNRGGPPSISTRNARLTTLAAFSRHSASYHILDSRGISKPLLTVCAPTTGIAYMKVPRRPRAIAIDDLQRLFAVIPKSGVKGARDRAIFLLFFWSGRRREEIARLKYGDIEEMSFRNADGTRRAGWRYSYVGKGGQAHTMELPALAKLAIDRYLLVSGRIATIAADDPLFVAVPRAQYTGPVRPLSSGVIYWTLKQYAIAAGLNPKRINLHSFRHLAAKLRYLECPDIMKIRSFLGHESVQTTMVYLESLVGIDDPIASMLEAQFGSL